LEARRQSTAGQIIKETDFESGVKEWGESGESTKAEDVVGARKSKSEIEKLE